MLLESTYTLVSLSLVAVLCVVLQEFSFEISILEMENFLVTRSSIIDPQQNPSYDHIQQSIDQNFRNTSLLHFQNDSNTSEAEGLSTNGFMHQHENKYMVTSRELSTQGLFSKFLSFSRTSCGQIEQGVRLCTKSLYKR